jgi:hypothetical protein
MFLPASMVRGTASEMLNKTTERQVVYSYSLCIRIRQVIAVKYTIQTSKNPVLSFGCLGFSLSEKT